MSKAQPLPLPPNFNPDTFMLARWEGKMYHAPRLAAEFANDLLANGTREDVDLAEKVLDAMLACQETREGDPHLGNFLWEREDEVVEDLNAVQFCLFQLIPLMINSWECAFCGYAESRPTKYSPGAGGGSED